MIITTLTRAVHFTVNAIRVKVSIILIMFAQKKIYANFAFINDARVSKKCVNEQREFLAGIDNIEILSLCVKSDIKAMIKYPETNCE
jgi:hypothetical protein